MWLNNNELYNAYNQLQNMMVSSFKGGEEDDQIVWTD